ncbi:MAG: hypothetical protein D8M58_16810 [Calditrichaeota bacterium]|nr:MAG: hypothetical protein DWQ03_11940 [Calditrichota bacterium]MBL1207068.1 hypothetical protein [Calditrichota bacterium]NOG46898.1 hypothetical protein [Calditrichota bacterium]
MKKSVESKKPLFKIVSLLLPFLFLTLLEVGLRVFNYGGNLDLFISKSGEYSAYETCNPAVARRYFVKEKRLPAPSQDIFLKVKPKNGYRIFVLGGSSAAGYPYGENVMFSRILHRRLTNTFPDKMIEVVNTAMPAINSYAMLDFVDEILDNEPDAILIYGGHNEFYGALGIGSSESLGKSPSIINWILKFQQMKTIRLMRNILNNLFSLFSSEKQIIPNSTLMERMVEEQSIYFQSDIYKAGINQFRTNLADIIQKAKDAKVKILLSELVSNIGHQKPFVSQRGKYNADSTFALAQDFEKEGNFSKAKELFFKAKDYDMLRFRAPEEFNTIIQGLAALNEIPVVPLKQFYSENSRNGITGNNLMLEHLHPNFKGYVLMAEAFIITMRNNNFISSKWPVINKVHKNLKPGITKLDSSLAALKINILKGGWPFKKRSTVNTVLANYKAKNRIDTLAFRVWKESGYTLERGHVDLAIYYSKQNNFEAAFNEYNALTQITPYNSSPYIKAAEMLIKLNRFNEAGIFLKTSLKYENSFYANKWLGQILLGQTKNTEGLKYLQVAYKKNNRDSQLLYNLGGAYYLNKEYALALEKIEELEKISTNFPRLSVLKSRIIELQRK